MRKIGRLFIFPLLFNYMEIKNHQFTKSNIYKFNINIIIQLSSFAFNVLAPCFMLCEDSLLSRIEDVRFLDVESKMTLFITFHDDHEFVNESIVQRKILGRIYKKLLNVLF